MTMDAKEVDEIGAGAENEQPCPDHEIELDRVLRGLIVAALLVIGSLPFFVGLAVVLPVLGHATWHVYRKVVEPDPNPPQEEPRSPIGHRYAADFPASLFPWSVRGESK
jgi:hypothetical protein